MFGIVAWMVVLVLAREIWITGLRGVAAGKGVIMPASSGGKLKSGLQMVAIVFLLLHDAEIRIGAITSLFGIGTEDLSITCQLVGLNFLFISIVFSYWSAGEYTSAVFMGSDSE